MNRVLHTVDTWGPGGAETVCVELACGVDQARFPSYAGVVREGWVHDTLLARGIDASIVRPGRGPVDVGYLWRVAALARRHGAALIQSHLLTANLYCAVVGRLLGIPVVATFHGMVDVAANDRLAKIKLRIITANVSRLVFVSEALRRHFRQSHAVAHHRTVVIPNGVDERHYSPSPTSTLRTELGLDEHAIIVAAVGNVRPAKGYDDLLRAAALLRDECPQLRFVIVGQTTEPLYGQLVALRQQLGLEHHVTFLGFRDDIAAVLNGVDLYVSTSTSEGFSLTTIQAMACGLAVIATRSGGPEEIVTDGQDGLLVPVADPVAMAAAIAHLVNDVTMRHKLAAMGRETVLRRFTLQQMIASYEALYEEALARA